ncbi:MAG: RDD family protein [Polyangiales bacterium]
MSERDQIEVIGPEGVPLRFPAALVAERAFAFCVDMALVMLALFFVTLVSVYTMGFTGMSEPIILLFVGVFFLRYGYFTFFEIYWQGSTPGKRLLNIKVISRDGGGLSTDAVVARNLMRDVELFIPLVALFAPQAVFGELPWWLGVSMSAWLVLMLALPFFGRERARVGDLVGGTLVIRVPRARLIADAARHSLAPAESLHFNEAQLKIYGEAELETLAKLLRDFDDGVVTLHDLAVVAQTIARKIQFASMPADPASFLRGFYKAQRVALEKRLLFGKRKASKFDAE